jgi:flagellar hook-associated protein 2
LNRSGSFIVDETTLSTALTNYYSDITQMFSANTDNMTSYGAASRGIAGDLVTQIDTYLSFDGLVKLREKSYSNKTSTLTTEQAALDKKMISIEARYTKQFSTMSKIMDEMKSTQDWLESSLGNLPYTSDNN